MAVAAPARRSTTAPAPAPSRTKPPKRKAPARKPQRARAVPAPAKAPARRPAPKRAPPTTRPKLAVVAGRTAVAVSQLPDSSLVVRMTRGRAWIAVLGVLLVGIVALNVATLSFAASAGKIDEQITALEKENSMLESREAKYFSTARIRNEGAALGLAMPTTEDPRLIEFEPADVATAANRLAAAGG
ncbi:MAG TPA: hypothetical protein VNC16_06080 [Solirubrobacterales bacterium]|jgi:hypothetical protein|nr:hypothetical protein [Solirubrobacterales bacterium]